MPTEKPSRAKTKAKGSMRSKPTTTTKADPAINRIADRIAKMRKALDKRRVTESLLVVVNVPNSVADNEALAELSQAVATGWMVTSAIPVYTPDGLRQIIYSLVRDHQVDLSKLASDLEPIGLALKDVSCALEGLMAAFGSCGTVVQQKAYDEAKRAHAAALRDFPECFDREVPGLGEPQ